ncbi:hypothetical protein Pyn_15659 [Prunus yedoensis var. nudiflora]|uniref:Uncharacterized protein n=1 Tax=Prunus yedoensis var. nudiflora TaxID=2094558 RepID=A0A314Y6E7_PRUYE|nr:hypothetical protein Pyn_15659 [Prunus yedoensis var. nudiflora]
MSAAILLFCLALCCYWNLEPHTVFSDLSWSSTILLKIGKLSDFIGELQSLLNGTGEQSEGDFDAIASQDYKLGSISEKQGLKEIAESLFGTLTKSTDAIVRDDIEGPGMKPRNLLRSVSTKC